METIDSLNPDSGALLGLMASSGYSMAVPELRVLAEHLSKLDGRVAPWTPSYLRAIAKGQLQASARMRDAIERSRNDFPPPKLASKARCKCGRPFVPNRSYRRTCYQCRKVRSGGKA